MLSTNSWGIMNIVAIDFETYSEAGFIWDELRKSFRSPEGSSRKGLSTIGVANYARHPSTEVLSLAYDMNDGMGPQLWVSSNGEEKPLPPKDLMKYIINGGLVESWNTSFEFWIWNHVCIPKYGFVPISGVQMRCAMAKSRAFCLPGSLADAGEVLNISNKKLSDGKRLLEKFSIPRNPTQKNKSTRIYLRDEPEDEKKLYEYNIQDIKAEHEISSRIPELSEFELGFWKIDQAINYRGVVMDRALINNCIHIVEQARKKYDAEIFRLTDGAASSASEIQKIRKWIATKGVVLHTLDAEIVTNYLKSPELPSDVRRVLEIREITGLTSVSKLYSMKNQMTINDRIHDLFVYHSARTGRHAGRGVQPQNLPSKIPNARLCTKCNKHCGSELPPTCPWCGAITPPKIVEWNSQAVEDAFETVSTKSLECVEMFWGNALATISGCLRGLFVAAPGHDLICSDYSAIEAVVAAELAGESWQQEVFRTHGKIYEMTASKITGVPFEEILPGGINQKLRKLGKVAALASNYGSWLGGWKAFHADEFLSEKEMKTSILAWRHSNPAIVNMWNELEQGAINAIENPQYTANYQGITYKVIDDILYCGLRSGRFMVYHKPRLRPSDKYLNKKTISFEGVNNNPKYGNMGWCRMDTYGGRLFENVCQATARDILAYGIINLETSGYPIVLHVHDEIVSEVPENTGSIEEFERLMSKMPKWAEGWPIYARGGWRAKRYAK